jgi:hypothetical protein
MKFMYSVFTTTALVSLLLVTGTSCSKFDKKADQPSKIAATPTTSKPGLSPTIPESQMLVLNKFNPAESESDVKYRSTDEVFGTGSDRSYAYNEFTSNKISYDIYGGSSQDQTSGRWFSRKILQWDGGTHTWKTFFDDGVQFFSRVSDDISLQSGKWYYTVQWVWDPAANKWIKFDADLLIHV